MDLDEALAGDPDEHATVHEELFTIGSRLTVPVVAAVWAWWRTRTWSWPPSRPPSV
jgi:hypothetical protein